MSNSIQPAQVGSNAWLGLDPIAYLYHDADKSENAHPLTHSTLLVLAYDRQKGMNGETPLVTLDQAAALVAAERERWRLKLTAHRDRTVMSMYATVRECEAARNALQRVLDDKA